MLKSCRETAGFQQGEGHEVSLLSLQFLEV